MRSYSLSSLKDSTSVDVELATEEGGFGLGFGFLEKRPPRIAMAGKDVGCGSAGGGENDLPGTGRACKRGYGRKVGEKDGGQRQAGWGAGTVGPRWMWSETDGGSECTVGSIKK